ncbi:hypothetical protein NPIL_198581 [Nephila pilipes]|uniref:Uncharacterized protein n=1 Tax=Nephila pilipes TaxID=299642 RepID=A0A8X6U9H5_NEPPI|nr:hypothetical protein NPIL_198581 [Nephila pilipes]
MTSALLEGSRTAAITQTMPPYHRGEHYLKFAKFRPIEIFVIGIGRSFRKTLPRERGFRTNSSLALTLAVNFDLRPTIIASEGNCTVSVELKNNMRAYSSYGFIKQPSSSEADTFFFDEWKKWIL